MKLISNLSCLLFLLGGLHASAYADEKYNEARGQLLYSTHCNVCHTSQVHWRDQKKVTGWKSLVDQVRHWQGVAGLEWSNDEIIDVAHYLNDRFYEYKETARGENQNPLFDKSQ
jgi:mono/diheme cytochrome c family protein